MALCVYAFSLTLASLGLAQLSMAADVVAAAKFKNNELIKPENYREWIFVGTSITPNDLNDGKAGFPGFHNVYIHPDTWKKFKKTGEFSDGTVFVKEIVSVGQTRAITGNGYFPGDFGGIGVAVKDKKRFPNEPGNWAYFTFDPGSASGQTAQAKPTDTCAACHQKNAAKDLVFTQYYPVLRQPAQ